MLGNTPYRHLSGQAVVGTERTANERLNGNLVRLPLLKSDRRHMVTTFVERLYCLNERGRLFGGRFQTNGYHLLHRAVIPEGDNICQYFSETS